MIHSKTLRDTCNELFADYPLAVRAGEQDTAIICSMVLMLRKGGKAEYYVLSYENGSGRPFYLLRQWQDGAVVDITDGGNANAAGVITEVIGQSIPLPRHGSVFGWRTTDDVSALILSYADWALGAAEPSWSVMPLARITRQQWPPFTNENFLGHWFWDYCRDGRIVSLSELIGATSDVVFWTSIEAASSSGCCIVASNINSPRGYMLPAGRYVYYETLQVGEEVPSLDELLARTDKIDLSPRLRVRD